MNWYLAKLVYRIVCGDGEHTPQFDEQLRLIMAEDDLHAFNKAQLTGHREQDSFPNIEDQLVQWKFIDVTELHKLHELTDGAEIYSNIIEQQEVKKYIHNIRLKSSHLLENCTQQFLQSL